MHFGRHVLHLILPIAVQYREGLLNLMGIIGINISTVALLVIVYPVLYVTLTNYSNVVFGITTECVLLSTSYACFAAEHENHHEMVLRESRNVSGKF